jgi:M6 family metalloprotease-like protein
MSFTGGDPMARRQPRGFRRDRARAILAAGVTLLAGLSAAASAVTLEEFGYGHMRPPNRANGAEAKGIRPLLTILAELDGMPKFAHDRAYYDLLIYNTFARSVSGYFLVNSNGRFTWTRAGEGTTQILKFSADVLAKPEMERIGHILKTAVEESGLKLSQFDENRDGSVTTDELGILMIDNFSAIGGANRDTDPVCVQPSGSTVSLCTRVAAVGHQTGLLTLCHELAHTLGGDDLYGANCHSDYLTLMGGCGTGIPDDRTTFHLDPWHKMQLGWCEPRVRSLGAIGTEFLPAANMVRPDAPVLLYDPGRGTSEYFMLEYRSARNRSGLHYDEDVAGTGLVVWHVKQDANKDAIEIPGFGVSVYSEGAPGLVAGGNGVWESQRITPVLRWLGGASTGVRVQVRPFAPTDSGIVIDWCHVLF